MKNLVIMDYSRGEVHVFTITDEAAESEDTIGALGFKPDCCSWMVSEDLDIIYHGTKETTT